MSAAANPRFELGRTVATAGVAAEVPEADMLAALQRHHSGDWGTVCDEDAKANDRAVEQGARILSSYDTDSGHTIWVITEADRSVTTILFPEEY